MIMLPKHTSFTYCVALVLICWSSYMAVAVLVCICKVPQLETTSIHIVALGFFSLGWPQLQVVSAIRESSSDKAGEMKLPLS